MQSVKFQGFKVNEGFCPQWRRRQNRFLPFFFFENGTFDRCKSFFQILVARRLTNKDLVPVYCIHHAGMPITGIWQLFYSPGKHRQLFNDTRPHSIAHRKRTLIGRFICYVDGRQISVMTHSVDNLMTSLWQAGTIHNPLRAALEFAYRLGKQLVEQDLALSSNPS